MSAASFSEPFIRRPVGTTLLAAGLFLVGAVAYLFLPVASMPTVDYPTISVSASRPGAGVSPGQARPAMQSGMSKPPFDTPAAGFRPHSPS